MRRKLAACILHSEVLLVVAHHRHQHFFRQIQIRALKPTQQHLRPLGQMRHLVDQLLILTPACTFYRTCHTVQRLANLMPPRLYIDEHKRTLQLLRILRRSFNRNFLRSRQYAVPIRHAPGFSATKLHRHNRIAQQTRHPQHGPHKPLRFTLAPIHVLGPVNCRKLLRHLRRNHFCSSTTLLHHAGRKILTLRRLNALQLAHRNAVLARKRLGRRSRHAILERNLHRRPRNFLGQHRLLVQHVLHPHSQPSRRGVRLRKPARRIKRRNTLGHQPRTLQHRNRAAQQLRLCARNHPCRNFFQSNLKQKLCHLTYPPISALPAAQTPSPHQRSGCEYAPSRQRAPSR